MADETPATPSFQDKLQMDAKTLWNDHKVFLVLFGILILVVKFRDILISAIVSGGKKELDQAHKDDATLAAQETKANDDANKLVQQAKDEPLKEVPVGDDWNKK